MREKWEFGVDPVLELIDREGVEGFVFDYDDTFCGTADYIDGTKWVYSSKVARKLNIETETVFERLSYHNNRLYDEFYVNPIRWIKAGEYVSLDLTGSKETLRKEERVLMRIFDNVPQLFPGVKSILEVLKRRRKKIGMVTWAPLDWTMIKLERHGIGGYLDSLVLADVDKVKDQNDWRKCIFGLGCTPGQVIGSGDSVNGDVIPLLKLGVRGVISLPNSWVVNHAEVPAGAIEISGINYFFDGVERVLAGKI